MDSANYAASSQFMLVKTGGVTLIALTPQELQWGLLSAGIHFQPMTLEELGRRLNFQANGRE